MASLARQLLPPLDSRAALVVVGLDAAQRVVGVAENRRRWSPRSLCAPHLVGLRTGLGAESLVLFQFVPNKRAEPSAAEAHAFRHLASRCAAERTRVVDCIVVSGDRRWSLAQIAARTPSPNGESAGQ